MAKSYMINEVFYSIQGEGILAGTSMVFVRFSKCNMRCDIEANEKSPGGFACDTEFESGLYRTLEDIEEMIDDAIDTVDETIAEESPVSPSWLLLTGGEPALQVDIEFCDRFHNRGWNLAIETNGSIELPLIGGETRLEEYAFDHICVSPKVAEHAIKQLYAHEVKYVRAYGQGIPKTRVEAQHYLISPATSGLDFNSRDVQWCVELVKQNPRWRLTAQLHKLWSVR